eukprot:XP_024999220.1 wiskott-Aldrich syndrome protein homolog 1-like [Gallus gallus]
MADRNRDGKERPKERENAGTGTALRLPGGVPTPRGDAEGRPSHPPTPPPPRAPPRTEPPIPPPPAAFCSSRSLRSNSSAFRFSSSCRFSSSAVAAAAEAYGRGDHVVGVTWRRARSPPPLPVSLPFPPRAARWERVPMATPSPWQRRAGACTATASGTRRHHEPPVAPSGTPGRHSKGRPEHRAAPSCGYPSSGGRRDPSEVGPAALPPPAL